MNSVKRIVLITCGLLAAGAMMDGILSSGVVVQPAAAIVGAPATPVSVAGVARRTTRRAVY